METELEFARDLAKQAGSVMLRYLNSDQHVTSKSDGTPVTIADTSINQLVIEAVAQKFPDDGVVGEEASTTGYGSGRRWICDPIDGTAAFIQGLPTSMFSLCLVVDGRPTVAVTYEPQRDHLFSAIRGRGAFRNGERLHVSGDSIDAAIIGLAPEYVRTNWINQPFMQNLLALGKRLAIFEGAVFRSCLVASGGIAGFPHPQVKPYDIAAVHLLVEEAGGKVTGITGEPLDYTKPFKGAVISNGVVHNELLALFKS